MAETDMSVSRAIEIRLDDEQLARDMAQRLQEIGGQEVEVTEERGILPLLPIVVAAVVAGTGIAQLVFWIRDKTQCQLLIDARGEQIKNQLNCSVRDGRVIVVTKDDVKVEITDVPKNIDFTDIVKAALSAESESVKDAAEKAGATATTAGS
jgi:hypothetical protein